jgi:hypothetical protein
METLNENLTKGTPFETKPLRMIKINNVEVSEKMPILVMEDKSEITPIIRKATIEEVLNEEAPILIANQQLTSNVIIEEIPPLSNNSEDSDEEPLKVVILEFEEVGPEGTTFFWNKLVEPEEDKIIIIYIQGEPVIRVFEKKNASFTREHNYLIYDYIKNSSGI